MYTVKFTAAYKKSYKLMKKRGLDLNLLDKVVDELRQGNLLTKSIKTICSKVNMPGFMSAISNQTGF